MVRKKYKNVATPSEEIVAKKLDQNGFDYVNLEFNELHRAEEKIDDVIKEEINKSLFCNINKCLCAGVPDFIAWKDGEHYFIEAKKSDGLNINQLKWLEKYSSYLNCYVAYITGGELLLSEFNGLTLKDLDEA